MGKRPITWLIFTVLKLNILLVFPVDLFADKIILRDGRVITVGRTWEEDDQIKGSLRGSVIGFPKDTVDRIDQNFHNISPQKVLDGFIFDIWRSGLRIHEAMDIAERNDVPLLRDGFVSINKHFNPDTSLKYAPTHNRFYYKKDGLLGKPAKIEIQFTPKSRLLYKLLVQWGGPGASKNNPFFDEVQSILKKKYGEPYEKKYGIPFHSMFYNINPTAYAMLQGGNGSVSVYYFDRYFQELNDRETREMEEIRKRGYTNKDSGKF